MNFFSTKISKLFLSVLVIVAGLIITATHVFAAGNINGTQKYSQFFTIDLNADDIRDFIDWSPTNGGANVTDSGISGYIWGETVGWINLSPTHNPVTLTCPSNPGDPAYLGGYAWGQNTGWINFAPTNATGANKPQINTATGKISGTVWSQNYGWIQLSSPETPSGSSYDPSVGLVTSWHGCGSSPTVPGCTNPVASNYNPSATTDDGSCILPSGGGSGGGSGGSGGSGDGGCASPLVMIGGVCTMPVSGCTNPAASNYNSSATINDGSCTLSSGGSGGTGGGGNGGPGGSDSSGGTGGGGGGSRTSGGSGGGGTSGGNSASNTSNTSSSYSPGSVNGGRTQVAAGGPLGIFSIPTLAGVNNFLHTLPKTWKWVLPLVGVIGLLGTLPGIITRFANLLLGFLFGRKKQRGIVYDSVTKEALDPAYVSVIDIVTGKEILNQITDIHGRYGFVLKKGSYKMTVGKTHYQFPSEKLAGKTNDETYDHLYFGGIFTVENEQDVVTMNIPMDPLATDWNQEAKRKMGIIHWFMKYQNKVAWIAEILFGIGFLVSLVIAYYYPDWWNITMVVLYVIITVVQSIGYGPVGFGTITKNGVPVAYAIVRVYNATLNHEVAHTVTSDKGGYYILVAKGHYYVTIETKNPDGTYTVVFTSPVMDANQGLVNRSFKI